MSGVIQSLTLMLVLLNPLLVIIYLVDVVAKLTSRQFGAVLFRAAVIATVVFCCFAVLGDAIFVSLFQAEFGSFQIFGGLIFLLIGLQFVFRGPDAVEVLRGESNHLAGAIAMPVLIGPGTISASVVIGQRHPPTTACVIILVAVVATVSVMFGLKVVHDIVRPRNEILIERYIEIAGRITALYVGTVAVEMIMQGIQGWMTNF